MLGVAAFSEMVVLFVFALVIGDDPRMSDGGLSGEEATMFENILIFQAVGVIISAWLCSSFMALKNRRWGWLLLGFFVWPLSPLYLINPKK